MGDSTRGLYGKFKITRTDGSSRKGRKHATCEYFVLDLDHDEHAFAAIVAYAQSCKQTHPYLAADLLEKASRMIKTGVTLSTTFREPEPDLRPEMTKRIAAGLKGTEFIKSR